MVFVNSATYKNMLTALEGELKASSKYSIYADKARKDGFEQIGAIFDETSQNEREHAEIWLKLLNKGDLPSTLDNLKDASAGEYYEFSQMYKDFAKQAKDEGFAKISRLFDGVASIEKHHDERFKQLAENIEKNKVFMSDSKTLWVCRNCGNVVFGFAPPAVCSVCRYPQAYYEILCENY